ncbi:hypothetical protein LTR62_007145 [Meristemomyces frigidus]|uniref:Nudix hydrolase domain-containing protein n=1 Tax=Meristemomyces frigidus TaxID=1508187 RepID=A0AAN7TMK5_9PEZI|nr:hypothetical protein LTR62_007145 [Meristemomyces frigidus]
MGEIITNMSLVDWLDDLTVRFLLNLPASELSSVPRLCFQVEEAQWFYEDFIRPAAQAAGNPLPSLPLRQFCLQLFQHCPLWSGFTGDQHIAAYEEFLAYKVRVPVRGAILMDESMEKLVLVKGWKKSASWSFPRGKINKDEKDLDCAVREVYEETGFDVRAAGLIPQNEEDAKFIDVTMREQHMRLFVFRNVREDTYFEPQTRKEISKIAWYNVRDLPGFKKQKNAAEHANHTNKFYMVAPFLGPLKRWIAQQRRVDAQQNEQAGISGNEPVHASLEDKTNVMEELVPTETPLDRSADLSRLLGIGGVVQAITQREVSRPSPAQNGTQSERLLAMLQGGAPTVPTPPPQTPFEQINAAPEMPTSPHPHHPRQPSITLQQPVPHFPFSLDRLQHEAPQHNFSMPTPSVFGGPQGLQELTQQGSYRQHGGIYGIRQQHDLHSMQHGALAGQPTAQSHTMHHNQNLQESMLWPPQMSVQATYPPQAVSHFPRSSDAFMAPQGPQGATSGGPSVPKAEHLPMPKLNAHSVNLLNTFRSGEPTSTSASMQAHEKGRQPSQHQKSLLDLFGKPSTASGAASTPTLPVEAPGSPTLTGITIRPSQQPRKTSTMNEITRTLPPSFKKKSSTVSQHPPAPSLPSVQSALRSPVQSKLATPQSLDRSNSHGQLYDPSTPSSTTRPVRKVSQQPEQATVPVLQQSPIQVSPRSARPSRTKHASPSKQVSRGNENGAPQTQPQFTILARPDSLRGQKSPGVQADKIPLSPLSNETHKIVHASRGSGVQVLQRPESVDPATVQKVAEIVEEIQGGGVQGGDKRDQLLALFSKPSVSSPSPSTPALASPPENSMNDAMKPLGSAQQTVSGRAQSQQPVPQLASMPPPPPSLLNAQSRSSSNHSVHQRQQTPQNLLLDLFNKPSILQHKLNSPGTPISPFALGTPATRYAPNHRDITAPINPEEARVTSVTPTPGTDGARSRLGSMASINGQGKGEGSRKGSGAGTPVEAKGFLLGYLNGVVAKEGYKGNGGANGGDGAGRRG